MVQSSIPIWLMMTLRVQNLRPTMHVENSRQKTVTPMTVPLLSSKEPGGC